MRYSWKENLISGALALAISIPVSIYAINHQSKGVVIQTPEISTQVYAYEVCDVDIESETELMVCDAYEESTEEPIECPYTLEELDLLARVVFAEAGNCSEETMYYVASVVLNRCVSSDYPNTVYDVVYQRGQYACTWDGNMNKIPSDVAYEIAEEVLVQYYLDGTTFLPSNVIGQADRSIAERYGTVYTESDGIYFFY